MQDADERYNVAEDRMQIDVDICYTLSGK